LKPRQIMAPAAKTNRVEKETVRICLSSSVLSTRPKTAAKDKTHHDRGRDQRGPEGGVTTKQLHGREDDHPDEVSRGKRARMTHRCQTLLRAQSPQEPSGHVLTVTGP
jgi:hypothetical protein